MTAKQADKLFLAAEKMGFADGDLEAEIAKAAAWEASSPRRQKKLHAKFFIGWLTRNAERRHERHVEAHRAFVDPSGDKQRTRDLLARLRSGGGNAE